MFRIPLSWCARHERLLTRVAIVVLLLVVVAEGFLLNLQSRVRREADARSDELLTRFLETDSVLVDTVQVGVPIRLENVRFMWSDRVYIDATNLAVRAVPVVGTTVDFDDLDSFVMRMQRSDVRLSVQVLEGMLNESVFNYPESKLRDIKLSFREDDGERKLHMKGKVNVVAWVPFSMDMHLGLDRKTNTIVVDGSHFKILGFLSVTKLIKLEPFQLEHILSMPPNQSLLVHSNQLRIKPFGLFPPPRVNGTMTEVKVEGNTLRIEFGGAAIPAPESRAPNYVYLKGGSSKFGNFRMEATDILLVDRDPSDPFSFSLQGYRQMVPRSTIEVNELRTARLEMPDYGEASRIASRSPAATTTNVVAR
jgi:hypothetical protein